MRPGMGLDPAVMLAETLRVLVGLAAACLAGMASATVGLLVVGGEQPFWLSAIPGSFALSLTYRQTGAFWNRLCGVTGAGDRAGGQ